VHEPWSALISSDEAQLTYPTGHGERSLPVRYIARPERRELTVRLPEFNDAVHYVDGCDVTIEVAAATHGSEAARVRGRAAVVADDTIHSSVAAGLEHWPSGVIARFIVIVVPDTPR
jgi:hypothetical protein